MGTSLDSARKSALAVSYDVKGQHIDLTVDFVKSMLVRGDPRMVTDQEAMFFMQMCKMQGLNPLNGNDVYLVKYKDSVPASMVIGKAAYLKRAFENPNYLYKEDGITVQRKDGEIFQKEGCCLYPGETLVGGWCRIYFIRNGVKCKAFREVSLNEYNSGQSTWRSKTATMINKVAISQCVREAFPVEYQGLYADDEMVASGAIPAKYEEVPVSASEPVESNLPNQAREYSSCSGSVDPEPPCEPTEADTIATKEQRDEFLSAIKERYGDKDSCNKVYGMVMRRIGRSGLRGITVEELSDAMSALYEIIDSDNTAPDEDSAPNEDNTQTE